jgi:hypothetical protein
MHATILANAVAHGFGDQLTLGATMNDGGNRYFCPMIYRAIPAVIFIGLYFWYYRRMAGVKTAVPHIPQHQTAP